MERWRGRVALVTGASSGIGRAIAEQLVRYGMNVVAVARNMEHLQDLCQKLTDAPGRLVTARCEVRNEEEILSVFEKLRSDFGRIDVLVNSAGISRPARLSDGATEHWREMLEVNVLALSVCTREALNLMKTAGVKDGHIIHISSMSGYRLEGGDTAFYACTKHAVKALTEGLRRELREQNSDVRITSISPGNVATRFLARKFDFNEERLKQHQVSFKELDAKDIADAVIYALSAPAHVQVFDILLRPNHQST